ncbi:hypothetical protein T484DRAFT_1926591 [Baffinella frigidus]|nr:hypothetical protein T484DRAFT_1926591 [Cryptophyta sp. CCMP2293]
MPTRRAALLALLPLVSAFAPSPPLRAPPAASSAIRSGQPAVCRRGAAPLALIAGLDPGTALPNLDAFYFSGCLAAVVGAGLLQFNAGKGEAGLGTYLNQGPEDRNWEKKQAKASQADRKEKNEAASGSWFSNLLPKLDFVEVYGQEKETSGPIEIDLPEGMSKAEGVQILSTQLNAAVKRGDEAMAMAIKSKIQELGRPAE